jgi:hypothetical protein
MKTKAIVKQKPDNPFDDISFWLELAATDFSFGFDTGRNGAGAETEKGNRKTVNLNPDMQTMRNPEWAV